MATDNQPNDPDREPSPWSRSSVLISGMFLLVILLGGITFVILKSGNSKPHRDVVARPGHTTTTTTTATGSGSTTGCALAAGNQAIPSSAPPSGTQWETVGSMQVPEAPSVYGPQRTSGVFSTCFAHNPTGALLAAINFWAEGTAAPSGQVFRHLAVNVPAADLTTTTNLASGGPVQLAGYKYDSYASDKAQISVVLEGSEGKLAAFVMSMEWIRMDWRYAFPPGGVTPAETIPSLIGYVQWSEF
jgi:hypothetical protein